jgi:hypothetical protein
MGDEELNQQHANNKQNLKSIEKIKKIKTDSAFEKDQHM